MNSKIEFSKYGRLIPSTTDYVFSEEDRRYFAIKSLSQPSQATFQKFKQVFGNNISISEDEFSTQIANLIDKLQKSEELQQLLNGPFTPYLIPKNMAAGTIEAALNTLLELLGSSYVKEYPAYEFKNFAPLLQKNMIKIVENSRLNLLLENGQHSDHVGLYFPTVFAGYSIYSQRQLIKKFPAGFALSGPLEIACALIGSPGLLLRTDDTYPNGLAASGIEPTDKNQKNFFWYFESYGWNLNFNYRSMVGPPSEYFSGGLSFFA